MVSNDILTAFVFYFRPNFTSSMNAEIKGRVMSVKRKLSFDVDCSNPESKDKQAKINAKVVDITDCNYNKVAAQDIGAGDSTDREGMNVSFFNIYFKTFNIISNLVCLYILHFHIFLLFTFR